MKFCDVHCHLADVAFADVSGVMARAKAAGVERMACCGTSPEDWQKVFSLAVKYPPVIPMIGIHPWAVSDGWNKGFRELGSLLRNNPRAGIGETGLDGWKQFINHVDQEASFAAHLDLACELNRPVAVHCVHAWGRLIEILRGHSAPRVLLHAFSGAVDLIPELIDLNCWFSFCGLITNSGAKRARAAVVAVPANRLLIETDAPDFTPADCQPPNEPANLIKVACAVADIRRISIEDVSEITFDNSNRFFASFD